MALEGHVEWRCESVSGPRRHEVQSGGHQCLEELCLVCFDR